ncbi:hypothetical protein F4776DRAFT_670788 [Hypoxylon sp. NC0597]|nr:hypothetical protein F4776DRAFT_670788 [Hypoxylon sp. NC0597]
MSRGVVVPLEMEHDLPISTEPSTTRPTTSQLAIRCSRTLVVLQMPTDRPTTGEFLATTSPVTACHRVLAVLVPNKRGLRRKDLGALVTGKALRGLWVSGSGGLRVARSGGLRASGGRG